MRNENRRFALAAAAVLILSACGDGTDTQRADANFVAPEAGVGTANAPDVLVVYPVGTPASLEPTAIRSEVERMQGEQAGGAGQNPAGQTGSQMSGATATMPAGGQSAAQTGDGTAGAGGGAADFASLDRDGDARLSPAEYAIHALPGETPARQGATNDEKPPYVSDEALNRVVTSFRRLDSNGDFFLSEAEFGSSSR